MSHTKSALIFFCLHSVPVLNSYKVTKGCDFLPRVVKMLLKKTKTTVRFLLHVFDNRFPGRLFSSSLRLILCAHIPRRFLSLPLESATYAARLFHCRIMRGGEGYIIVIKCLGYCLSHKCFCRFASARRKNLTFVKKAMYKLIL